MEHQYTPSEHGDLVAEARELVRRAKLDFLAVLNSQALPLIEQRLHLHNVREKLDRAIQYIGSSSLNRARLDLTMTP